jgi:hypothetical protein
LELAARATTELALAVKPEHLRPNHDQALRDGSNFLEPHRTALKSLSLALFVAGIAANHEHDAPAPHELAVLTNPLHAGPNLHGDQLSIT